MRPVSLGELLSDEFLLKFGGLHVEGSIVYFSTRVFDKCVIEYDGSLLFIGLMLEGAGVEGA